MNIRLAKGDQESASFRDPESSNDGYWRAVLIRWFGISLNIPTPVYPPNRFASPLMYRVYRLLPMAEIWRAAAERVLSAALRALNATTPSNDDALALALVDRCFKVQERGRTPAQIVGDIASIRRTFQEIRNLFDAIRSGKEYLHDAPPGPEHQKDNAYTYCGHWKNKKPDDGIWYVKESLEGKPDELVVDVTMHECAHFVSEEIGHAKVAGQTAYGKLALTLSRGDALKNASSYAWLAYLARKPSSVWLTYE